MTDIERAAWLSAARSHYARRRLDFIQDIAVIARDADGQRAHIKPLILAGFGDDKQRLAVELESVCRVR